MTKKKTFMVASAVALALVLTAGGLVASNMGFKLNYQLLGQAAGVSQDGTNTIALPYNPQSGITTASALKTDIGASCINVQKFLPLDNSLQIFAGGRDPNFDLDKGVGYRVRVNADTPYIIVGSHDPAYSVPLTAQAAGVSQDGTNEFAYPYHATAGTALDLKNEIGASCINVQKFLPLDNSLQIFAGGRDPNFDLEPGQSYRVRVSADVSYAPSHY